MTLHALVHFHAEAPAEVLAYRDFTPADDQLALPPHKSRWLPVTGVEPAYDAEREIVVGPVVMIEPDQVLQTWSVDVRPLAQRQAEMARAVNAERDQRMRSPFTFGANQFDYDSDSQKRITGAGALAHIAITVGGKQPDDLRWHDGAADFVWIAADNTLVAMDAQTVLAFGQAAGAWESAHIFAARALKDAIAVAADHDALDLIDITTGWPA